jgi:hypothetical protein
VLPLPLLLRLLLLMLPPALLRINSRVPGDAPSIAKLFLSGSARAALILPGCLLLLPLAPAAATEVLVLLVLQSVAPSILLTALSLLLLPAI